MIEFGVLRVFFSVYSLYRDRIYMGVRVTSTCLRYIFWSYGIIMVFSVLFFTLSPGDLRFGTGIVLFTNSFVTMAWGPFHHCGDVIMGPIASQITSPTIVYSTIYSGADQKNIKAPRRWPVCGEFTGTGEFPAQMASNAENVSIR